MARFLIGVVVGGVLAVTAPAAAEGFVWIAEHLPGVIQDLIAQFHQVATSVGGGHWGPLTSPPFRGA